MKKLILKQTARHTFVGRDAHRLSPSYLHLFCIADPDLQDPAFPRCCLSKWSHRSLQELLASSKCPFKGGVHLLEVPLTP